MKKCPLFMTLILTATLLGACRDASDEAAVEPATTTTSATTEIDPSSTTENNSETTLETAPTDDVVTEISTTIPNTDENTSENTTFSLKPEDAEENGESPYPTYFNYMFGEDTIGVRLSGGNYQSLHIDLTGAANQNLDFLYRLEDCNFDGHPDLVVPTQFGTSNVSYAIFIWDPDEKLFIDKPLMMLNPTVHPERKTIVSSYEESSSVMTLEVYNWVNEQLTLQTKYTADFAANTLTTVQMNSDSSLEPETENFATKDALESAFQSLL